MTQTASALGEFESENACQDVDDVFAKYDRNGKGTLDVHSFVVSLINPLADPEPWFQDRPTYEFHVPIRAPLKKASFTSVLCAPCCSILRLLCARLPG